MKLPVVNPARLLAQAAHAVVEQYRALDAAARAEPAPPPPARAELSCTSARVETAPGWARRAFRDGSVPAPFATGFGRVVHPGTDPARGGE